MNNKNRVLGLDGLRSLAIVSVVLFHLGKAMEHTELAIHPQILSVLDFGQFGVQLFFCISGFVISLSLNRHKSPRSFFRSRIMRIWPSLIVVNSIILLVWLIQSTGNSLSSTNLLDYVFSNILLDPKYANALTGWEINWTTGVLWSLSIEIFFYIASAIGWYLFRIKSYVFISGLVFCYTVFHLIIEFTISQGTFVTVDALIWEGLILYLPWFVVGSVMFELVKGEQKSVFARIFLVCTLLFLEVAVTQSRDFVLGINREVHLLMPLFLAFLTWISIVNIRLESIVNRKLILFAAKISYDLYLSHEFIIRLVVVQNSFATRYQISETLLVATLLLIAVVVSCFVSVFTYELSERLRNLHGA
jgi:peptidoglycan/LPS O-acetylase OafA/YrhL